MKYWLDERGMIEAQTAYAPGKFSWTLPKIKFKMLQTPLYPY